MKKFLFHTRAIRRRIQTALINAKNKIEEFVLLPMDLDYNYDDYSVIEEEEIIPNERIH